MRDDLDDVSLCRVLTVVAARACIVPAEGGWRPALSNRRPMYLVSERSGLSRWPGTRTIGTYPYLSCPHRSTLEERICL
jgi:hypothetical protein